MVNQPASLRYAGWVGRVVREGLFRDQNMDIHSAYEYVHHKVHTYKKYYTVCPLVGIGPPPTPHPLSGVPLFPEPKGGGAHSSVGEGLGESQFQRLEKKLSTLPTR
jgi:hypothetical protein